MQCRAGIAGLAGTITAAPAARQRTVLVRVRPPGEVYSVDGPEVRPDAVLRVVIEREGACNPGRRPPALGQRPLASLLMAPTHLSRRRGAHCPGSPSTASTQHGRSRMPSCRGRRRRLGMQRAHTEGSASRGRERRGPPDRTHGRSHPQEAASCRYRSASRTGTGPPET